MSSKRITVWVQRFKDRPHLVLQWIDPDTRKRKSKSAETADEKEAEGKRSDLESDLNNGRYREASRMTWERFRELFEEEYLPGVRPRTRVLYGYVFDLFEEYGNPGRLAGISERTLSAFVAGMRRHKVRSRAKRVGLAPNTIRGNLQYLQSALAWAVEQKMITACPGVPAVKVPRKRPQPVPAESFEKLLDKAPDAATRAFLLCGWLAGLRLKEAFSLEWDPTDTAPYLDPGRGRIVLPAEFAKAVEDQWVPLDPALAEVLEALPRQGRRVFRFVGPDGRPVKLNAVGNRVVDLAKRAGVKLSMHTLRKGFGCRYAGKVSAHVLQRLMRHADIKTTMTYYANIDAAVEEAVFGPGRNGQRNNRDPRAGAAEVRPAVNHCEAKESGDHGN